MYWNQNVIKLLVIFEDPYSPYPSNNSENIFFTGRESRKAAIFYIFVISLTGLEGNLKINGETEQSHTGYWLMWEHTG